MDKKTYVSIIVMLVVVLIISIGGWIHSRNKLNNYKVDNYGQYEKSLVVCEKIVTDDDYNNCVSRLEDFGKTLTQYQKFLKIVDKNRKNSEPIPTAKVQVESELLPTSTPKQ